MKKRLSVLVIVLMVGMVYGCASTQKSIYNFAIDMERSRADLKAKTVQVEGESVSYLEREGSGEIIILVHGFTADKNNWLRFVRYIPEKYRVLAIDMPGHGDNIRVMDRKYDPSSLSSGIAKTIDALELKRFHIAGNSLGGLVSKIYSVEHPDNVITLGLFDSAGVVSREPSDFQQALKKEDNPFVVKTREDYDRLIEYAFYDEPFMPWPIHAVMSREYIKRNDFNQKMFGELIHSELFTNPDFARNTLPSLKVPVFVIWGDKDRLLHVSSTEVYQDLLPQVEVTILKDCGHIPMIERPEESADHYSTFLEKHSDTK